MSHTLKREKQCRHCPFRADADISKIPNYSKEQHKNLEKTIAKDTSYGADTINVMSCHCSKEGDDEMCIGWLHNQLGEGNNINLRIMMMNYDLKNMEVYGKQLSAQEFLDLTKD